MSIFGKRSYRMEIIGYGNQFTVCVAFKHIQSSVPCRIALKNCSQINNMISVVSILIGLLIALLARNRKVGYRKSYGNGLNEETKAKKNYWYLYGMNLIVNVIL